MAGAEIVGCVLAEPNCRTAAPYHSGLLKPWHCNRNWMPLGCCHPTICWRTWRGMRAILYPEVSVCSCCSVCSIASGLGAVAD
eukprot:5951050-Amphidinium_carterae.1